MKKNNLYILLVLFVVYVVYVLFIPTAPAYAAYFTLDPQTRTASPGETFSVDVKINTENEEVTSADALFDYNSSILSVSSITPGTFFPQTFKTTSGSQVYVGGAVQNAADNRSGTGLIATINFTTIGSGTTKLAFDCTAGKTSDSNITRARDASAPDILDCAKLVDGSYTISGTITSTQPTPTPKSLPEAGSVKKTMIFAGLGIILTIVGIISMLMN